MKHECFNVNLNGKSMVSRQTFDGTNELAKYIKTAETNQVWKKEGCRISSRQKKESDFNDFDSFEDAVQALEYGTDLYYQDFKKNIKQVEDYINKNSKNKVANYKNDQVGFIPIVPKVLQGNPINMINQDVKPKPFPTARIILEKSNSCHIKSNDMNKFYAIIFVLIQLLENKGIRCEIWVVDNAYECDEIITLKVKLKNYMQPLNLYKIQFPIIASDFFRRIGFRIIETNQDIKERGWCYGYGSPLLTRFDLKQRKKEIYEVIGIEESDIYIPSCQYFDFKEDDDLDEALKSIINKTNLKNYIQITD